MPTLADQFRIAFARRRTVERYSRMLRAGFNRVRYAKQFVESEHPRDEEGKFTTASIDSRGKWVSSSDGFVHVYHGTSQKNYDSIKSDGLRSPEGTGPGWLMVTSSREQAQSYGQGYTDNSRDIRIVHFAIPQDVANSILGRGLKHSVYGVDALAAGLIKGHIPPEYIADQ